MYQWSVKYLYRYRLQGPRPHPNEMAGSDLDGDEYFVTWHPDLIFRGPNEPPMDFPSIKKGQLDHEITVNDMVEFIVRYIVNDKVGIISNAHLAWADKGSIHTDKCKELARIFCHVIDFNKTGFLPPEVEGKNIASYLPDEYPDFMGKHDHKETYQSPKALGKLYRISKRIEQAVTTIDKEDKGRIEEGSNWKLDERFLISGYEPFNRVAQKLYEIYAEFLDADQQRYGIESEEELVSGCVIKIKGNYSRTDDIYDIEKRLRERMRDVRKFIRDKFDELLQEAQVEGIAKMRQKQQLAAACYIYTYRNKKRHRSFPWVFSDHLLTILQQSRITRPDTPMQTLTKSIDDIDLDKVKRAYRLNNIDMPDDEDLKRVYYVLINWGQKSKFLPTDNAFRDTLTYPDFTRVLDRIVAEDVEVRISLSRSSGHLLRSIFRAVTNLDDSTLINQRQLNRSGVMNMKRQMLLGHHQLARDPRADCLMIRLQSLINRTIKVSKSRWGRIKHTIGELRKQFREKFDVKTEFRRSRNGGFLYVRGREMNVLDFDEYWHEQMPSSH